MIDVKEFLPKSFCFGQIAKSATLCAVISTACLFPTSSNAQSTTVTMTPAAYVQNTTIVIPVVDATAMGAAPGIDYGILADTHYDYAQIARARALGLSDMDVARCIALAEQAGVPMGRIVDDLHYGWTFETIATKYCVSGDWRADADTDRLHDYLEAYRSTGRYALRYADMNPGVVSRTLAYNDTIVTPPGSNNIVQTLRSTDGLRMFTRALHRTGLDATLEGTGPYTVFAPTDSAFDSLPKDELKALWKNKAELTQVIQYHIIPADVTAAQAMAMSSPTSPPTLEGDTLQVTTSNNQVMINGNLVTKSDIDASNGVIHEIDAVLIPTTVQSNWNSMNPMSSPNLPSSSTPVVPTPNTSMMNPTPSNLPGLNPGVVTGGHSTLNTAPTSGSTEPGTTNDSTITPNPAPDATTGAAMNDMTPSTTSTGGVQPASPSGTTQSPAATLGTAQPIVPMSTSPSPMAAPNTIQPAAPLTTTTPDLNSSTGQSNTSTTNTTPPVTATPDSDSGAASPSIGTSGTMNGNGPTATSPATGGGNTGTVGSTSSGGSTL